MNPKRLFTTAAVTATIVLATTACGDGMSSMNHDTSSTPASSQTQMPAGHSMSSTPSSPPAPHPSMPGMPNMPGMDHGSPSTSPAAP